MMWSNRETEALFTHLTAADASPAAAEFVKRALADVDSIPAELHDYEKQAVAALVGTLRGHVEAVFEDFFFGAEAQRTPAAARMCRDVGSLWRVDWDDLARAITIHVKHAEVEAASNAAGAYLPTDPGG